MHTLDCQGKVYKQFGHVARTCHAIAFNVKLVVFPPAASARTPFGVTSVWCVASFKGKSAKTREMLQVALARLSIRACRIMFCRGLGHGHSGWLAAIFLFCVPAIVCDETCVPRAQLF